MRNPFAAALWADVAAWTEVHVAWVGVLGVAMTAAATVVAASLNARARKVEATIGEKAEPEDPTVLGLLRTIETLTRGHQDWMTRQEEKLDRVVEQVGALGEKVDSSTAQITRVEERLDDLETRSEHTAARLDDVVTRLERLEDGRG